MCKHIAAVLYGIGARLDHEPELLFVLRQVDSLDLVAEAGASSLAQAPGDGETIAEDELADLFGIDLDEGALQAERPPRQEEGAVATTAGADVQPLLDTLTRPTLLRLCEAFELDPGRGYAKRGRLVELLAEEGPRTSKGSWANCSEPSSSGPAPSSAWRPPGGARRSWSTASARPSVADSSPNSSPPRSPRVTQPGESAEVQQTSALPVLEVTGLEPVTYTLRTYRSPS